MNVAPLGMPHPSSRRDPKILTCCRRLSQSVSRHASRQHDGQTLAFRATVGRNVGLLNGELMGARSGRPKPTKRTAGRLCLAGIESSRETHAAGWPNDHPGQVVAAMALAACSRTWFTRNGLVR
jgi:hypothetical protein